MTVSRWQDTPSAAKARLFLLQDERGLVQVMAHLEGQLAAHLDKGRTREALDVQSRLDAAKARLAVTRSRLGVAS